MRKAYQRARSNPHLLCLEDDIASLETKQQAVLARLDEENPPPWGDAVEAFNDWKTTRTDEQRFAALAKLETVIRSGAGAAASQARLWAEFRALAQEKAVLVTAERNWLAKLRAVYTAEQGEALRFAMMESARRNFGDQPDKLAQFVEDILRMFDYPKLVESVE
jgi:hypothetical protein